MRYYRVWLGYDKYKSVNEEEVKKVMRAKMEGATVFLPQGMIDGKYVSLIEPDFNRMMGYNPDYKMTGEDMASIPRIQIKEHENFLVELAQQVSDGTLESGIENKRLN